MVKRGIQIDIPGFRNLDIRAVCSDYTGTLSLEGELIHGVKKRLRKLASLVDIYVLTSDTRGTAKIELQRIPLNPIIVEGRKHDVEKRNYLRKNLKPKHVAVLGNGRNDKLWLREVSEAGGPCNCCRCWRGLRNRSTSKCRHFCVRNHQSSGSLARFRPRQSDVAFLKQQVARMSEAKSGISRLNLGPAMPRVRHSRALSRRAVTRVQRPKGGRTRMSP